MITNSIVVLETGHNMKSFFLWSIFLTVITRGSLQGVCTDSGGNPVTDVSTSIETKVIFGTLTGGYSIVCQYRVTGSYNLYLWRLQKDNGGIFDTIYTYFTATSPPSSQAGSNYASRNLSFENNNTVVFPSLESSDVGSDTYRCTIQFNAADVNCVESPGIDVNAKPDDITYQFGDLDSPETGDLDSDSLPIDKNMIITISGKNFLTSDMPSTSFIFNIGSNITLNERITDLSNGFKEFNATISYRTPSSYSEDIPYHLYLVINDLSTEIDKGIFRTTCGCQCSCDGKTRDKVLLAFEVIFLLVLGLQVVNILIGRQVISCNAPSETEGSASKIPIIICIVILMAVCTYGIICVVLTQVQPTIRNEAQVAGQKCCCSTCDPNGDNEKTSCESIAKAVLAFGIILILVAAGSVIAISVLAMVKGLPWINRFLFICGGGCCSSSPPPSKNDQGKKESVGHGDNPSEKPKTEPESVPLNTTNNPVTQPPKNRANTTTGPANRNQNSSNDTAKTGGKTAKTGGEATKTGGETAGNETRTTRKNSDVSSSNVTVEPTS